MKVLFCIPKERLQTLGLLSGGLGLRQGGTELFLHSDAAGADNTVIISAGTTAVQNIPYRMIQGSGRRESGSSAKTAAEYRDLFPLQHRLRHHLQGGIEPGSPLGQNEGNTVRRAALIRQPVAERLVVLRKAPSISGDDDDAACAACGTFIEHLERGIIQHQETK